MAKSAIGKALGFPGLDSPKGPDLDDESTDGLDDTAPASEKSEPKAASAEVLAMKQFERAASPEAKVQALKDFLEACGCTMSGSSDGAY